MARRISPSPMYFKVCGHYLHALTGDNLIQESLVTFFVSFLTDVLIGSCFLPQYFFIVLARVLVARAVHYSILVSFQQDGRRGRQNACV